MKVTRANEYWGIPEDTPRRTATPLTPAQIAELTRGPRVGAGQLRWAAPQAADPSMPDDEDDEDDKDGRGGLMPRLVPEMQRLEHSLGNEGGSSPTDGTPERWPIIMPGDKLLNAGGDVADMGLDALESTLPKKKKKSARRRIALKELWLRVAAISPGDLYGTGQYLGTHDAQVHEDESGKRYLVKPPRWDEHWPAPLDMATAQLQQRAGLTTPEIQQVDWHGVPTAVHTMFPAADAFPGKRFDHSKLAPEDIMTLQKHNVLDWLMSNHDAHPGQFIRHKGTGELIGIDKGQAFRYFGQDRLDPSYHPNQSYGEQEPMYNTMWRNFARGKGHMNDPRTGELGDFIQHVQSIPDDELKGMFRPYAEQAAAVGKLATGSEHPNNPEAFLDAVTARKNNLHNDFADYYTRHAQQRQQAMGKVGRAYGVI